MIESQSECEKTSFARATSSEMMFYILGGVFATLFVGNGVLRGRTHVQMWTDAIVATIVAAILSVVLVLEALRWVTLPIRLISPAPKLDPKHRRIVIFDGICVLCNNFGAFVVYRLVDPNAVKFVPFQDIDNAHVDIESVRGEFGIKEEDLQLRIAVVSGDKLIWGAQAIMEICQWMVIPYPAAAVGRLLPQSLSDSLYLTVARNRYDFFGTQPLDKNFAKKLCPYYWINPPAETKAAAAEGGGAGDKKEDKKKA